jgi:hypothetical protein
MDAHKYIRFNSKIEYFMYFLVHRFFFGFGLVQIFGVNRFDDCLSFDNIGFRLFFFSK